MSTRFCTLTAALTCLAALLPPAFAQIGSAAARPSQQAPSMQGPSQTIGGRFTQGSTVRTGERSVATIGESAFRFPQRPARRGGAGLPAVSVGLSAPVMRSQGENLLFELTDPHKMMQRSVTAGRYRALPAIDSHKYTPRLETTRFQDYFGLKPATPPPVGVEVQTISEGLKSRTEARLQQAEEKGRELFRQATVEPRELDLATGLSRYPNCRDCTDNLALAGQMLRLVSDLDKENYVAPLLLAHALLEQERPLAAASQLMRAWQRHPDLLEEASPVDEFFGDTSDEQERSVYLDAQLRRFAEIGRLNPGSPQALVLEAYCSWRLGDLVRARAAAERAIQVGQEDPEEFQSVLSFAEAMAAVR